MKFVAISDTHGKHADLVLPEGDILIHAGDVSSSGTKRQVVDFLDWFEATDFAYKIFIAGNHDFFFENNNKEVAAMIPNNIIYLNDSGISVNGIHIWGSPVQPWFYDWAFNRQRGGDIKKHWDLIPTETNVLITHGPAHQVLDQTVNLQRAGCQDLANKIMEIQPCIHISGHIHEGYGKVEKDGTTFINASVLDHRYRLVNPPQIFDLPSKK